MSKQDEEELRQRGAGPVVQALAIARLIVTHRPLRRQAMIGALLLAAAQCFVGSVLLGQQLEERPTLFVLYWAACFLFVAIALGLAVLDLLKLRGQLASGLRELREELDETDGEGAEDDRS